ncbi:MULTISPECIES: SCO2322 family protein [Streptomyces]|uniref:SCO2322 family protein n=1 Tax=Streptomyces cyaneofuscatus TaxID=66883 RepID=A0ABZ1ETJ5_9ACTN|nr:SCO2322 family protein [Streptomyces cyaneofuscatus]WSB07402.1 SCO2322 family protein [Streptomyces cyaneofuscatus]WSD49065.1 SCO2322 family protein [Streptomyces cyaneofuscatus]WTA92480.1 SCO2322 family protein [Streptomyces cyaneofuscatus]
MTRTPSALLRSPVAALLAVLLAASGVLFGAGGAQAAGYRYWSFWEADGKSWGYATQGPSLVRPDDGTVQGFRFAVSEDSADADRPRHAPDFAAICADTPAKGGAKRVALVIDPGTAEDAPDGEKPPALRTACAQVAPDASSAEALASVAKPLRYDSSAMICAISGYPKSGCGEQVSGDGSGKPTDDASASSAPAADDGDSGGGPSAGLLLGIGAVLLLGIAAVFQARRRR